MIDVLLWPTTQHGTVQHTLALLGRLCSILLLPSLSRSLVVGCRAAAAHKYSFVHSFIIGFLLLLLPNQTKPSDRSRGGGSS